MLRGNCCRGISDNQRQFVRLVTQSDDEGVDAERVAGQVESDEDGGHDQQGLGDAQLRLMALR